MGTRVWIGASLLALALLSRPAPALPQQASLTNASVWGGSWLDRWQPLGNPLDIPRPDPAGETSAFALLAAPPPRAGLFWTLGNPAALPAEAPGSWSGYALDLARAEGGYRGPLDPGAEDDLRLRAEGWGQAADKVTVVGRATLGRSRLAAPAYALTATRGSSPLVVLDTTGSDLATTGADIAGAVGIGLGRFALGLSLGFEGGETRTIEAPVPRSTRTAAPTAMAGATWRPTGGDRLRIGVHARWNRSAHWVSIWSRAAPTRVYELAGYSEPAPIDVTATFYRRNIESEALGFGAGVAGRLGDIDVLVFGETGAAEDRHWSVEVNDPPTDRWNADALHFGLVAGTSLLEERLRVLGGIEHTRLDGRARIAEHEDAVTFTADESATDLWLDLRSTAAGWLLGLRVAGRRLDWLRADSLDAAAASLESWTTAVSFEAARLLGAGFSAAIAGGVSTYRPAGAIPAPADRGRGYLDFIGPQLAECASDAGSRAAALTLSWSPAERHTILYVQARAASSAPEGAMRLPLAPAGNARDQIGIAFGVQLPGPPLDPEGPVAQRGSG